MSPTSGLKTGRINAKQGDDRKRLYQRFKLKENELTTFARIAALHIHYNTQSPPDSKQKPKSRRLLRFSFTTDNSIQPQNLMPEYRP